MSAIERPASKIMGAFRASSDITAMANYKFGVVYVGSAAVIVVIVAVVVIVVIVVIVIGVVAIVV